MSQNLFARPAEGKAWKVDAAAMDDIERTIAARAVEAATPAIIEAARVRAQADVDAKLPKIVKQVRRQTAATTLSVRPGWHREFVPTRDSAGRIVKVTELWKQDAP